MADLPSAVIKVRLRLLTRRFTCEVSHCRRQIFAERFGEDIVPLRRRRTARLEYIVHHLGLALGGRPDALAADLTRVFAGCAQRFLGFDGINRSLLHWKLDFLISFEAPLTKAQPDWARVAVSDGLGLA